MARKSYVKGKTVNDLLKLDYTSFMDLSSTGLRQVVQRLADAGNKRLKTLERVGYSPAREAVFKSGGRFTTRGKDVNQLRAEYIRAKNFFEAETSSVQGARKSKSNIIKGMKAKGVNINDDDFNKIFSIYSKLQDIDPIVGQREFKYEVFKLISDEVDRVDLSSDDIVDALRGRLDEVYENTRQLERGESISDFFEF